mgnify:CR=1 FL=1
MSTWLQTFSGLAFDYDDPKPGQIDIRDIAHALGRMTRFVGHTHGFYSVAEHSVHAARLLRHVDTEHARAALMHDAHEAYVVDLPSPLKRLLPDYRAMEAKAAAAVRKRFGLPVEMPPEVKRADDVLLASEAEVLQGPGERERHFKERPLHGWKPRCWSHEVAKDRFLAMFAEIFPEVSP